MDSKPLTAVHAAPVILPTHKDVLMFNKATFK
jgi:hypothetical protein